MRTIDSNTLYVIRGDKLKELLAFTAERPFGTWDEDEWDIVFALMEGEIVNEIPGDLPNGGSIQ